LGSGFGTSVASAGDQNGDGYDDAIVGSPTYSNGESLEGSATGFLGSASGLSRRPASLFESGQASAEAGISVASAGDVNGDGYADRIVGIYSFDHGQADEGAVVAWYGRES
jgi:FG-GAP repeat